jgi:hypothetical protein
MKKSVIVLATKVIGDTHAGIRIYCPMSFWAGGCVKERNYRFGI